MELMEYIQILNRTVEGVHLSITDLHILTDILTRLSNSGQPKVILGIFSFLDCMLDTNSNELVLAKNTIQFTSRILKIIDAVLRAERRELAVILKKNILLYVKSTSEDRVIGASVLSNGTVEYLVNKSLNGNILASFLLPSDLVSERESDLPFPCHLEMVFFKEWTLFPNPKGVLVKRNYKVLSSPVLLVALSGGHGWNLSSPVELYFRNDLYVMVEDPVCVHYENEGWSGEGCEYVGLEDGFYHCRCHHLSIFSIILSISPESESPPYGTTLYVGCIISIIPLAFSVLLYLISNKWRKTVDHGILFHLCLSFLCFLLTLLFGEMSFVTSFALQYFLLGIFGWLLVHAIVHKMRFSKKTDLEEVPLFQLKAAVCSWGAAAVIIFVIWMTRDILHSCLVWRAAVIPIMVLVLVTLCLNLCAVYAITCRYRRDYLLDNSSHHESVIKFRVAFTIFFLFVLCWVFGLFSLYNQYKELRILFSICITLTAYYTTLFFVFQETSLWEMCHKKDSNEEDVVTFAAKPSE